MNNSRFIFHFQLPKADYIFIYFYLYAYNSEQSDSNNSADFNIWFFRYNKYKSLLRFVKTLLLSNAEICSFISEASMQTMDISVT